MRMLARICSHAIRICTQVPSACMMQISTGEGVGGRKKPKGGDRTGRASVIRQTAALNAARCCSSRDKQPREKLEVSSSIARLQHFGCTRSGEETCSVANSAHNMRTVSWRICNETSSAILCDAATPKKSGTITGYNCIPVCRNANSKSFWWSRDVC